MFCVLICVSAQLALGTYKKVTFLIWNNRALMFYQLKGVEVMKMVFFKILFDKELKK
jgi:hypothetical protein